MNITQHIQYIKRADINPVKWDRCIETASNGLIYGYHQYLNTLCSNWDALVLNDYEAVMPLPWRKKLGIYYIYFQPFCAALGVFGNNLDAPLVENFLLSIPTRFRYWHFPMNHGNLFHLPGFTLQQRINFVLPLQPGYETISRSFRENIKRNIRKCHNLQYNVDKGFPVREVIELASTYQSSDFYTPADYDKFEKIFHLLQSEERAITYGIRNMEGKLLASAGFIFSHQRAYYILVGNHPDGKTAGASHALIDAFIRDYAGKDILLDFEGSDVSSLAFFYSSFGAKEEYYPEIRLNGLPALLKWLKK